MRNIDQGKIHMFPNQLSKLFSDAFSFYYDKIQYLQILSHFQVQDLQKGFEKINPSKPKN